MISMSFGIALFFLLSTSPDTFSALPFPSLVFPQEVNFRESDQ